MGRLLRPAGLTAAIMAFSVAFLASVPCRAQTSVAGSTSGTSIVVAWAELGSAELGPELRNAAVLVPRQLMAALDFVDARYPGEEEVASALRRTTQSTLEAAKKAVADARARRDLVALSVRDPARRAADLLTAETALEKAEAALALAVEKSQIILSSDQPVQTDTAGSVAIVRWAEHANGSLVPVVDEPAAVCAARKIDLLVYGTIRPRGASLAIELSVYGAALDRVVWTGTDHAFADGLEAVVDSFVRPVAGALLGRPYARAEFRTSPPAADVYLDETVWVDADALYFEPGTHGVTVKAQGFETAVSSFQVEPGQDIVVEVALAEKPSDGFALVSDPPGAAVHFDGARVGFTPLDVPGSAYPRVARLSMPGYDEIQFVLRPGSTPDAAPVPLAVSDGFSFDDRFDDRKGAFYHSLGWFIVSLPVTVLSGGLFQTYFQSAEAYDDAYDDDERNPDVVAIIDHGFTTSQTVFWTSAAISLGFAVNAIIRLALYIGSAQ